MFARARVNISSDSCTEALCVYSNVDVRFYAAFVNKTRRTNKQISCKIFNDKKKSQRVASILYAEQTPVAVIVSNIEQTIDYILS